MDKQAYWKALTPEEREQVANKLGRSRYYLDHVFLYGRKPGPILAVQIHEMTGGKVPVGQFRDDLPKSVFRRRPAA